MPLLEQFQRRAISEHLVASIKVKFLRLAASGLKTPACLPLYEELQRRAPTSCLGCLTNIPSNTLTCGHRLCDACVLRHSDLYVLKKCTICDKANKACFRPKPTNAGLRVLRLAGDVEDAPKLAALLKQLRSYLCGPLLHYFDLILCSGVGIFFGVMMSCQGADAEDCAHHFPRLRNVKITKEGFSFGPELKFYFSDLSRSQVKMILRFKERI